MPEHVHAINEINGELIHARNPSVDVGTVATCPYIYRRIPNGKSASRPCIRIPFRTGRNPSLLVSYISTMPIDSLQSMEIIETMENFLSAIRPPENTRDKMDIGYRIENQSLFIFEIRPRYLKPEEKVEMDVAKTTYVKSRDHWKVYWMRGNLKWYPYDPKPTVKNVKAFVRLVEEDRYACFWG